MPAYCYTRPMAVSCVTYYRWQAQRNTSFARAVLLRACRQYARRGANGRHILVARGALSNARIIFSSGTAAARSMLRTLYNIVLVRRDE